MGLDCSHDAFHGAYSAFNRFRQAIAKAMGGSYPPHETEYHEDGDKLLPNMWYWGKEYNELLHPGLYVFLSHSDCDGEISPVNCIMVANDLEKLLPIIEKYGVGVGHIEREGGFGGVCQKFINGCRLAYKNSEALEFG